MPKLYYILKVLPVCLLTALLFSCQEDNSGEVVLESNNASIIGYLNDNPSYSTLVEALDAVDLSVTLNLYGTITLFAPTNEAFNKYFQRKGISSISQIDNAVLRKLMLYHIYGSTYKSNVFISGSLPEPTMEGDFIKMDISQGVKATVLNNTVNVDTLDVVVTNGIVHVINDVLEPPVQTMYDWMEGQPGYSILFQAFKATGNDSIITDITYGFDGKVKWNTLFLESNEVLRQAGISSFDDLARRFSNSYNTTKNYTDPEDSLNLFVRYHCIERKYFLSEVKNDYLITKAQGLWLIFGTLPNISINRRTEIGVNESGQPVDIDFKVNVVVDKSNYVTQNGIIHSIDKPLTIYEPEAVAVTQRFAGDPAERAILYNGVSYNITDPTLFDKFNNDEDAQSSIWWLKWNGLMTGIFTSEWPMNVFGDYGIYLMSHTGEYSLEITTKPIFKGKYQLFVSYRRGVTTNNFVYFYWDGEQIGDRQDLSQNRDAFGTTINSGTDRRIDRGVGLLNLTEMGVHKFKLTLPNPDANYICWYSIEFVPVK